MSEVKTFFRFCPSCGKRFHIRLVSKELVSSDRDTAEEKRPPSLSVRPGWGMPGIGPLTLEENVPTVVEVEEFKFSYKCKHCGHEWTEKHEEWKQAH